MLTVKILGVPSHQERICGLKPAQTCCFSHSCDIKWHQYKLEWLGRSSEELCQMFTRLSVIRIHSKDFNNNVKEVYHLPSNMPYKTCRLSYKQRKKERCLFAVLTQSLRACVCVAGLLFHRCTDFYSICWLILDKGINCVSIELLEILVLFHRKNKHHPSWFHPYVYKIS